MSEPELQQQDVALSDVMLAMDVVDMLRHEDKLVARALNESARERALIERVRKAYAAQGIAVDDAMIANGVAALKEQEYAYAPPEGGFKTRLLMAWINRRRIGGGIGALAALFGIIAGGWYGFVEYPEKRERAEAVSQLNNRVIATKTDIDELITQRDRLVARWQDEQRRRPDGELSGAFDQLSRRIEGGLDLSEQQLESALSMQTAGVDVDTLDTRRVMLNEKLALQDQYLRAARRALTDTDTALADLERLDQLPARLTLLHSEARDIAIPDTVDAEIDALFAAATGALRRGDFESADDGADALTGMIEKLEQDFRIRIVSRPGELSGVIREPPNNRRASNYYLIVEAIDDNNRAVTVRIDSEEDGSHAQVSRWGVRVSESVFDRVRRDKQDDGIIQAAAAGKKRRGYLDIEYSLNTLGGTIHRWEAPR